MNIVSPGKYEQYSRRYHSGEDDDVVILGFDAVWPRR
jgi:hypothetical protein